MNTFQPCSALARVLCLVALTTCAAAQSPPGDSPADRLNTLMAERFAWQLREFPQLAMERGDYSHADRLADVNLHAVERRHRETEECLARLTAIPREQLAPPDQLNYDLFGLELRNEVDGFRFRGFLTPVGGRWGPQQDVPQMHERVRFANAADYRNYLSRLEQVPRVVGHTVDLLQLGIKEGRTLPRVSLNGLPGQFAALAAGGLDPLAEPFARMPDSIPADEQAALRRQFQEKSLPAVKQAMAKLADYVIETYLPACRTTIAAIDWPDGEAYYAYQLRVMTTTDLTAQQIHEIGLREVARIRAEMLDVIRRTDFMQKFPESTAWEGEELFRRFIDYLRTDPRFYYQKPEELLRGYRDICKRIDAELPRVFRTIPRLPYGVRPIPDFMAPSQTTAYYQRGSIDNGQPGYFYANVYALQQRPKYEMIALALHEAVPGHHFQIAIAQELTNVPLFRQESWITAYGEGWALYAERLGIDMGLYSDPYDDFGRLLYEMWRSCRLVVDPGMHALGWSRDRAVQFMLDNTALSELNINNEIDRYIAWPGQATAYKLGELKIRELRAEAEKALGDRFDLRDFHEMILETGCVPLPILEQRAAAWIAARWSNR